MMKSPEFRKLMNSKNGESLKQQLNSNLRLHKLTSQDQKIEERNSVVLDKQVSRVVLQIDDFKLLGIDSMRNSLNQKYFNKNKMKM